MSLVLIVLLPFAAAGALLAFPATARRPAAWFAAALTLAAGALLAALTPEVFAGATPRAGWAWLPLEGARFGFRLDGLAWMFAAIVLAIGLLVILYASYYLSERDPIGRFYAFFMAFMGAMLGIVLADNLLLIVVFWELTSLASFLLIGYWQDQAEARQAARMALTVTGAGGLALLAGVLLIGHIVGSYELDAVLASGELVRGDPRYPLALLLVLLGAFTKSAQVPFNFWLPQAMAAPTPVSAYLHSATMVKAGVFLLARLHPVLSGTDLWFWVVSSIGLATLLAGAYIAIFQHDLKGLLAYSTISHLGLITLLFGLDSPLALVAAVFHILNHATFKASLFMAAGIIDHETGLRDMRRLNGLWAYMPVTAVLAIVASAAMAGVPLLNGFLSKEMFFAETLYAAEHAGARFVMPGLATLAAAFSVAYSMRFIHDVFWNGEPVGLARKPHDPPFWMLVPVAVLALLCVLVGVLPQVVIGPILETSAGAVLGGPLPPFELAIWHGLNLPLAMSALALALGTAFYFSLQRLFRLHDHAHLPRAGRELFESAVAGLRRLSQRAVAAADDGRLQRYLVWTIGAAVVLAAWPFLGSDRGAVRRLTDASPLAFVVWAVGVSSAVAVVALHRRRLAALVVLGAVGLAVSLAFVGLSAPDLALTQLLVEFVSILLILLALNYLPAHSPPEGSSRRRVRDALLALAAGAGLGALAWLVMTRDAASISEFFVENALPRAFGTNIVNVILVDFRAFDTLGEITVLALAGLAVYALLAGVGTLPSPTGPGGEPQRSPLLQIVSLLLLPLAITVSLFLFLRGHDLPGGGFIAGLVLAVALLIPYMAYGTAWVESRLRLDYHRGIGWGLLVAGFTGLGAFAADHPFLTSAYWKPEVPGLGAIPIPSALFFDLGVYLTVTGATMLALSSIGRVRAVAAGH